MTTVREGQVLAGKYRVERVLGQGGMGIVVAAMHQQLEQRVALKFLLPEGTDDTDTRARFLREARAAVRLKSEHVARVLDVGTLDQGSPYIVMEFLEGRDLDVVLEERGPLPVPLAVEYLLQACEAIAEAHAAGIVHRDLKPANLFLTRRNDGSPCIKVLDFGISKVANTDGSPGMTQSTTMLGTPHYMSPEQLRSSRDVDHRSDLWALGMILYELLAGRVAFMRETLPDLCAAILTEPVPPLREHRDDLPPGLEEVVMKALSKRPAERHQTLAEFAQDLSAYCDSGEQAARKISHILKTSPVAALPPGSVAPFLFPMPGAAADDATISALPPEPRRTPRKPRRTPGGEAAAPISSPVPSSQDPAPQTLQPGAPLPAVEGDSLSRLIPVRRMPWLYALVPAVVLLVVLAVALRPQRAPASDVASAPPQPIVARPVAEEPREQPTAVASLQRAELPTQASSASPSPAAPALPGKPTPTKPAAPKKNGLSSDFGSRK